jgi:putative peptidoglycan lipid II flippase
MERLAGRYELVTEVTRGQGRAVWQGRDAVLDRAVGILLLDRDHPRADEVRAAASTAARVEHPGLLRVIDADVDDGRVFVVTPWWPGITLAERLAAGPLPPAEATAVVRHVAEALSATAADGVHHLVLDPRDVVLTDHGAVLVGVGVRAALAGVTPGPDADQVDAWRLGALLYAALTARWPGDACAGLGPAPMVDGRVARPRQVRAGVPRPLDDVVWRCLDAEAEDPLATPQAVAEALEETHQSTDVAGRGAGMAGSSLASWPWARIGMVLIGATAVAAATLIGVQVWQDANRPEATAGTTPTPTPTPSPSSSSPLTPTDALTPIPVAAVSAFDPAGDGTENDEDAKLAVDQDATTAWRTVVYASRDLGGLKPGVGLLLDLRTTTDVSGVDLELVGRGTDLQVLVSDRARVRPTDPAPTRGFSRLGAVRGAGDRVTLRSAQPVPARWVLIWLTALPVDTDGYRGGVAEVVVLQ